MAIPAVAKNLNEWRYYVRLRDNDTCQQCYGVERAFSKECHHISDDPALRLVVTNGKTLCSRCHRHLHHGERWRQQREGKLRTITVEVE